MVFLALITNTFREAIQKKFILIIFVIISLLILLFLSFLSLDTVDNMNSFIKSIGQESFRDAVIMFENGLISQVPFFVVFLLLIIMVSSFIPSMLEKGNIDLIISKPISRTNIVLGKFISTIIIVFLILTYLVGVIWLIVSLKTGVWHFTFLLSIIGFTFIFAVLYSLILLVGLISQNTIITILVNMLLFIPITGVLSNREHLIYTFITNGVVKGIIDFIYYILPKPWDMHDMMLKIIAGQPVDSWQPLITSSIFMVTMLALSIYYFKKKDY
ncbi:MAG: ABC transporter permease subunit [Ignavibacteriae bacterium]|nr:ABC transporter permease subunit [Ignavibacteriota bacterium]